jgi:hypothetical protein
VIGCVGEKRIVALMEAIDILFEGVAGREKKNVMIFEMAV